MTEDMQEEKKSVAEEVASEVEQNCETTPSEAEKAPESVEESKEDPVAAELAAAKDRYIRLLADFDNMRKRQARELEERTARANEGLLKALLPVFDHFEMALAASQEDSPFAQGVRMIADEFRKVLEQSGAEVIDAPEGTAVDPMIHEVLSMVPHAEIPQGVVVTQFRKGWRLGGKVVRAAQVVVSAGAPAPAAEVSSEEA